MLATVAPDVDTSLLSDSIDTNGFAFLRQLEGDFVETGLSAGAAGPGSVEPAAGRERFALVAALPNPSS